MDFDYSDWREFLKSRPTTVAATASAVVGVTAGYPFDTVKTRMQVSDPPKPMNRVFQDIVKGEGYRALWRGISGPLCLVSFFRSLTFTTYDGSARRLYNLFHPIPSSKKGEDPLPPQSSYSQVPFSQRLPLLMVSGAAAGSITCLFSGPLELVKVQLQVGRQQSHTIISGNTAVNSPSINLAPQEGIFGCIKRLFSAAGPLGFYRGFGSHLLRDSFGTLIYFGCYESVKYNLGGDHSFFKKSFDISVPLPICSLIAGGLAGVISWSFIFPIDAIKSRLQREAFYPLSEQTYKGSILKCAKYMYKGSSPGTKANSNPDGIKAFYRGLPPTLLRALPIHSLNFFVYEQVLSWVKSL